MSENTPLEVVKMAIDEALHEHYREFGRIPTGWVLVVEHSDGQQKHLGIESSDETSLWLRVGMLHAAQAISMTEMSAQVTSIEEDDDE